MGVEVLQGLANKVNSIDIYLKEINIDWNDVWYIGNDVNDLEAIKRSSVSLCPSDATKLVKMTVNFILKTKGGYGILSELVSILEGKTKYKSTLDV